ncbi:DUF3618 domain-containing protein [Nocardia sp. CWNU-33]|uniref:DUF3618 domain-containing protein n=1 Tax=Nocardia sp. CWNU-33 TaxID=3392117 RepID=UPI00398E590C
MTDKRHPPDRTVTEPPKPIVSGPVDEEALRADRDEAREQLGHTVSELTDKLDVKTRAKDKLHETADSARDKAVHTTEAAAEKAARARDTAHEMATQAKSQARELVDRAESAAPRPVVERGNKLASLAARRPVPTVVTAAVATLLVWWILRRRTE